MFTFKDAVRFLTGAEVAVRSDPVSGDYYVTWTRDKLTVAEGVITAYHTSIAFFVGGEDEDHPTIDGEDALYLIGKFLPNSPLPM